MGVIGEQHRDTWPLPFWDINFSGVGRWVIKWGWFFERNVWEISWGWGERRQLSARSSK